MNELPNGWTHCVLGDLAEYVTSGSRDWSRYYATKGALFIRTQDINKNRLASLDDIARVALPDSAEGKRTLIMRDDLLITITGANVGKCAHVDRTIPEAYVSQSVALVRLVDRTLTRFVHRQLIAPGPDGEQTLLQQSAYGLGRPVLNLDNVRKTQLYLAPLNEQKRIADKLDTILARVDACRERLDRVPAILKRFRQAVLAAATSGKLTEEWRAGQEKAEEWPTVRLTDVGEIGRGKSKHRPRNDSRLYGGPYPFIQTGDIAQSGGRITTHAQKYSEFGLAQSKLWPAGTVCITIAANIADTAILEYPACFPDSVVGFVTDPKKSLPEFIKWSIEVISDRLKAFAPATAQKNINLAVLNDVEFRCPPLNEQREIVRRVETLFAYADRLEARYTAARAQIERLTPALLAKAFRGELVPQDPNDEPASVLLERIRAARAATDEKPPRKVRTERKPMTTKLTTDTLKEIIRGLPTDQFTFDDLRGQVSADYETLKDVVFALLVEAPSGIKQVFDTEAKTMRLVRVKR